MSLNNFLFLKQQAREVKIGIPYQFHNSPAPIKAFKEAISSISVSTIKKHSYSLHSILVLLFSIVWTTSIIFFFDKTTSIIWTVIFSIVSFSFFRLYYYGHTRLKQLIFLVVRKGCLVHIIKKKNLTTINTYHKL